MSEARKNLPSFFFLAFPDLFLFQMQHIRKVKRTFVIAGRESMNWTEPMRSG
jgi:hypothetical protein